MGASNKMGPRGRMAMSVHDAQGRLVAERRAGNMVLRSGALLIARLFSGNPAAGAIDAIGVGFARSPGGAELIALMPPPADAGIAPEALRTGLGPESFAVEADLAGIVQVRVSATFRPVREIRDVTEAGLLAGDVLYNQVIFEAVTLRAGQDVTFFWQIDFPFGH